MAKKVIYRDFEGVPNIDAIKPLGATSKEQVNKDGEKTNLLDMIFDINPRTLLPNDDLGRMLNKNIAPEIVQFIKDNLMQDTSSFSAPGVPAGVDDDTVLALSRNAGETRNQYIERVRNFMDNEKRAITAMRDLQKKRPDVVSSDQSSLTS